jgi:hypothetical protein
MKTQYILISFALSGLFSCSSNDFLKETYPIGTLGESTLIISPEWEAQDYYFYCPGAGTDFTVTESPSWLHISSTTGTLVNGTGVLHCSASVNTAYSEVGIYQSEISVSSGNVQYTVPVYYLTEGNPVIQTEENLSLNYSNFSNYIEHLVDVQNTGKGILMWDVVAHSEWISVVIPADRKLTLTVLPENSMGHFILYLHPENSTLLKDYLEGEIVIASNDKMKRELTINVQYDLGNPSLDIHSNELNFRRTETSVSLSFSNSGNGILLWKIEDCPEWLTVSEARGMLSGSGD